MHNFLRFFIMLCACIITTAALAQSANDDCGTAIPLTINPANSCAATTMVNTTNATQSSPNIISGSFCAGLSANDDVWYTFTTGAAQNAVVFSVSNITATTGQVLNGLGYAVYSGNCNALLQNICYASGLTNATTITGLSANTNYFLRLFTGGGYNAASFEVCLQVPAGSPPNCATNLSPASGIAPLLCLPVPGSVTFTWTAPATGPTPAAYKVYIGTTTPGYFKTVSGTTMHVFNLLPNTTYRWYVVPTNNAGDATGCATPFTFTTSAEPSCVANNSCATATFIGSSSGPGTVRSTTTGSSISRLGDYCNGFTGSADDDVWFSFVTDNDGGDVTVALTEADDALDAVMHVYSGSCGSLLPIGCADDGASGGLNETVNLTGLAANTQYFIRVYGFDPYNATMPATGAFRLTTGGNGLDGSSLPVTLTNLSASLQQNNTLVTWQTLQEINNKGFELQKSYDAVTFTAITFITGAGNSTLQNNYSYIDEKIRPGITIYYRLKQIDLSGSSRLSNTVSVKLQDADILASIYPNPAQGIINIGFKKPLPAVATIQITNAQGQLLQIIKAAPGTIKLPVNIAALAAGSYFVKIISTTYTSQVQFIKK